MTRSNRIRSAVATFVVAAVLAPAAAMATYPGKVGRLALAVTGAGRNTDVYTIMPDGSGLRRLTTANSFDGCPAYSPNGRKIAFCSNRRGRFQIWTMNADGSGQRQVSRSRHDAFSPEFSADGRRIAFEANDGSPAAVDIYVVDASGGRAKRFTGAPGDDISATFSPDGKTIAFISHRKGDAQIWLMNASDGRKQRRLTRDATKKRMVDWSPNGNQLVYEARGDIWVVAARGSRPRNLTATPGAEFSPVWSPDGEEIAYSQHDGGTRRVYVMNADGSHKHPVGGRGAQLAAAWQPVR